MAITSTARVTGEVLSTDRRDGTSQRTGQPYSIRTAIIHGPHGLIEVTLPNDMPMPAAGDLVDVAVRLESYRDDVQARVICDYAAA